jgi:hypothetical protein
MLSVTQEKVTTKTYVGMRALLLRRQLGLCRYETTWMLLYKLRRAVVNVGREPLHGELETIQGNRGRG